MIERSYEARRQLAIVYACAIIALSAEKRKSKIANADAACSEGLSVCLLTEELWRKHRETVKVLDFWRYSSLESLHIAIGRELGFALQR